MAAQGEALPVGSAEKKLLCYAVWTNKGGVGKTTLSFHISTTFAHDHRDAGWKVLVCDLCPQANISMALLKNGSKQAPSPVGLGPLPVETLTMSIQELCHKKLHPTMEIYQTVAGYLQSFVSRKPDAKFPAKEFLVQPSKYNPAISDNMWLLCGDPALGISAERLDQYRRMDPGGGDEVPYKDGTLALRNFIAQACQEVDEHCNWFVIIDTNPAMTTYTQLALVAADRLIVPVNADDFSNVAVKALFDHLYGLSEEHRFAMIREVMFAAKAKKYEIPLPKVKLVVNNRQTTYGKEPSKVFKQMGDEIGSTLYDFFCKHQDRFDGGENHFQEWQAAPQTMKNRFSKAYTCDLQDFHSKGVHSIHTGQPFLKLHQHKFVKDCVASIRKNIIQKLLKIDPSAAESEVEDDIGSDEKSPNPRHASQGNGVCDSSNTAFMLEPKRVEAGLQLGVGETGYHPMNPSTEVVGISHLCVTPGGMDTTPVEQPLADGRPEIPLETARSTGNTSKQFFSPTSAIKRESNEGNLAKAKVPRREEEFEVMITAEIRPNT